MYFFFLFYLHGMHLSTQVHECLSSSYTAMGSHTKQKKCSHIINNWGFFTELLLQPMMRWLGNNLSDADINKEAAFSLLSVF